ncbi:hypothetical protein QQ045_008007 [Rhodiola kirilowii]
MAIQHGKLVENGECMENQEFRTPLIVQKEAHILTCKAHDCEANIVKSKSGGSVKMVLLSTFVAVCGSFEFGSCVGYSAPTQSAIRENLNLSLAQYSMFGSILTIGAMIGAATSGRIADFMGRKGAMRVSAGSCITGWLAVYFSKGAQFLDMGRFCTGYGIGVFSYVVPVFIAEIAPKNLRGRLTTLNQAKVGLRKEFEAALGRLRGKDDDNDISHEAAEIQLSIATLESTPKAKMMDLFHKKHICSNGVGLMIFQQFGGINGIGFYASETFVSAGLSSGRIGTIAYACIQVPITVVGAILINKSGRRPLIMVSATNQYAFLGSFLAATSFFLKSHDLLLQWVPVLAVSGVLVSDTFSVGMGAVPWLIMSEVLRGVLVLVCWACAWTVSYTFNFLMYCSPSGTFLLYSGFSLLTILFVAKLVPETKGKTLEEIQASINHPLETTNESSS